MRRVLIDDRLNFYKGNMHCHSTLSDGALSPEELKDAYKNKGYSFIAITDHDRLYSHKELCDENFLALTACEISIKQFPEQSTLVNQSMKVCHLNLYAKDMNNTADIFYSTLADHYSTPEDKAKLVEKFGDNHREYSEDGICDIIRRADENGFFVCYNHPRWSLENYSDYSKYDGVWGVEIFNTNVNIGGIYEYDINVFDDMLRSGKRIMASCGDDNHNKKGMRDSFGAFVMVNCDVLSYDSVISALLNGKFYVSSAPIIHSLYVENKKVYISCSDAEMITYSTAGRRAEAVFAEDGKLVGYAEFDIDESDGYFRLDVIDSRGRHANTQAYFISEILNK